MFMLNRQNNVHRIVAIRTTIRSLMWAILLTILIISPTAAQEPSSVPSSAEGQALWPENCLPCHGPSGQGDGPTAASIPNPMPNLTDEAYMRTVVPADYFDIIKNGRIENLMPPWENQFDDEQIWDLVAHSLNLHINQDDLIAGEVVYAQSCAECHGENGVGSELVPALTDWQAVSQQSLADWQVGYTELSDHPTDLTDEEMWQALTYARTFAFAVPQAEGVLTGQIINGTTDSPLADAAVTLRLIQNDTAIGEYTATADEEGRYEFTDLPTDPSIQYRLESLYGDIFYTSPEPATFSGGAMETSLDLNVYDTTTDASNIQVTQLHYLISVGLSDVQLVQIYIIGNDGDATYIGQDGQTFTFALPEQAESVSFQNDVTGSRFINIERGYADTEPVMPGAESSTIVVLYNVRHDGTTLELQTPLATDVASVSVLMQDRGATLDSEQLRFTSNRQIQGDNFRVYAGSSLQAGDTFSMRLTGLDDINFTPSPASQPAAAAAATGGLDQTNLRWMILAVGGLVLAFAAGVYPMVRPKIEDVASQRQRLALLISQLDEAFKAGDIDAELYRQTRSEYKAQLVSLMEK